MKRFLAGGGVAIVLLTGGLLFWQSNANKPNDIPAPPPPAALAEGLPEAGDDVGFGSAPPTPPSATKATREEVRFNRYDRNRDNIISRLELMSSRTKAFKELDKDNNNLLTFEEWATATGERFAKADGDRNGLLTRTEFATTKPKKTAKPGCKC
jgi:EF hand